MYYLSDERSGRMKTIVSLFQESVSKFGTYPALLMRPRWRLITLTYSDWHWYVQGIASILAEHNVKYQDRVIIIAPNSPWWGPALLACMWRGAIVVPLNTTSSPEFIAQVAGQTQASCVITISSLVLESISLPRIDLDYLPPFHKEKKEIEPFTLSPDDIAEIIYTSGTTGEPKGVVLAHSNIVSDIESIALLFDVSSSDRAVSILPLFHMYEQTVGLLLAMYFGASVMYANSVSTGGLMRALQEYRATKLLLVPEILDALVRKVELTAAEAHKTKQLTLLFKISYYLPYFFRRLFFRRLHKQLGGKLEMIFSGGAPLSADVEQKLRAMGLLILQGYGLTEASPVVTTNTVEVWKLGSVGKPIPGDKVTIADDGEICIEGPNVFSGYYKNDSATKAVFDEKHRFRTGDLGYFDQDGFLFVQGRKKYVIVTARGEKVHPEDIEAELKKNSGLIDVSVVGHKVHDRELVHAVLLGQVKNPQEIIDQANKNLAPYQHIQEWSLWPEGDFPRSATRKVRKDVLIEWLTKKEDRIEEGKIVQSASPLYMLLASITHMSLEKITPTSKLVHDLHFDSLMRIEFVGQIEERFNVVIAENMISNSTTVADIEQLLSSSPKTEEVKKKSQWNLHKGVRTFGFFLFHVLVYPLYLWLCKVRVFGIENLNKIERPVIFMANHITYADAAIVLCALPRSWRRHIAIAAAQDFLYKTYWFVAWLFEIVFVTYPLARTEQENVKPGLEITGRLLDRGYSILIFPEGKISDDEKLKPLKLGAGLIATEMDVPIIPVFICGLKEIIPKGKLFPRKRGVVDVHFGQPIRFNRSTSYQQAVQEIFNALAELQAHKDV